MTFDPLANWFNEYVLGSVAAANVLVVRMCEDGGPQPMFWQ